MPQPSTLSYVADLVIQRVLSEADETTDLPTALDQAYPFDEAPLCRRIWEEALSRNIPLAEEEPGEFGTLPCSTVQWLADRGAARA